MTQVGISTSRIVAVVARFTDDAEVTGTGYLIAPDRVLTAKHCLYRRRDGLAAREVSVVVRSDGRRGGVADIVEAPDDLDVALLVLEAELLTTATSPLAFGSVDRTTVDQFNDCVFVGYPLWQTDPQLDEAHTAQVQGVIRSSDGAEGGYLLLRDPLLENRPMEAERDWQGVSGALVFHAGAAIGVVVQHHEYQGLSSFRIHPLDRLLDDDDDTTGALLRIRGELGIRDRSDLPVLSAHRTSLTELVGQTTATGRLPTVAEVDPVLARVPANSYPEGDAPYVVRDVDAELREAVRSHQLVVVVGPSAAGKSRSALEALRVALPDHTFLQPLNASSTRPLLHDDVAGLAEQDVVVWLDDLERFLDESGRGLSSATLSVLGARSRWRIVATLRADRLALLGSESEVGRTLGQVLDRAQRVDLASASSNRERLRSELAYPDEDFSAGIGIGERLILGPRLLDRFHAAEDSAGWALVRSAVDLERTGLAPPYDGALLTRLAPGYLQRSHPEVDWQGVDFSDAFDWARESLVGGVGLLIGEPGGETFRALDYLVSSSRGDDAADVPDTTWALAVTVADPADCAAPAYQAHRAGRWEHVVTGCRKALPAMHPGGHLLLTLLGNALHQLGDDDAALRSLGLATQGEEAARAHAWEMIGDIRAGQADVPEALDAYESAVATGHQHTVDSAALSRAELVVATSGVEQGVASYAQALTVVSASAKRTAWLGIADLRSTAGQKRLAAEALVAAAGDAENAPDRAQSLLAAGSMYADDGDLASAVGCYQRARDLAGNDPDLVAESWCRQAHLVVDAPERQVELYEAALGSGSGVWVQEAALQMSLLTEPVSRRRELLQSARRGPDPRLTMWAIVLRVRLEEQDGDLERAADLAEEVLERHGAGMPAQPALDLGETLTRAGRPAVAETAFRLSEAAEGVEESGLAALARARVLRGQGQMDASVAAQRELLATGRGAVRELAARDLADTLRDVDRLDEAVEVLDEVLSAAVLLGPELRELLGRSLWQLGRPERARAVLAPLTTEGDPRLRAHALEITAMAEQSLGDLDAAMASYQELLDVQHAHSASHAAHELASWHAARDETEAALGDCRTGIRLSDPLWGSRCAELLADLLVATGERPAAVAEVTGFVDGPADASPGVLLKLGLLLESEGSSGRALLRCEAALRGAVETADALTVQLAAPAVVRQLKAIGETSRIRDVLETMSTHGTPEARAWAELELGRTSFLDGDIRAAVERFEGVVAMDVHPYVERAWAVLAEIFVTRGDVEDAETALGKVPTTDADSMARVAMVSGLILLAREQPRPAAERFRSLTGSQDAETRGLAWFNLGVALLADSQPDEAAEVWRRCRSEETEPGSHLALIRLAQLVAETAPGEAVALLDELSEASCEHVYEAALVAGTVLVDAGDVDAGLRRLEYVASAPYGAVARRGAHALVETKLHTGADALPLLQGLVDWDLDDGISRWASGTLIELALEREDPDTTLALLEPWRRAAVPEFDEVVALATAAAEVLQGHAEQALLALLDLIDSADEEVSSEANLWLGREYLIRKDTQAARKAFERAARGLDDSVVARARQELTRLGAPAERP